MPRTRHAYPTGSFGVLEGVVQPIKVAAPGAGNDWSLTFPGGYYYRLLTGYALFTASAAVANRNLGIALTDGTNLIGRATSTTNITAGATPDVTLSPGAGWAIGTSTLLASVFTLPSIWLPPGYRLSSRTLAIDAADAWTNIVLLFELLDFGDRGIPFGRHPETEAEQEQMTTAR